MTQARVVAGTDGKLYAQVVYDYPDELYDFFKSIEAMDDGPLSTVLQGGIDLSESEKPTAVDTMPQTGKTDTKRRRR